MIPLEQFGLAIDTPLVTPSSRSYRPPSFPPPRDWVVVEDAQGNPVSRWGDPIWCLDLWVGASVRLNFGDAPNSKASSIEYIDQANADLLRLLVTWKLWSPRGPRSVRSMISAFYTPFRSIISLCSREGILASDLMRYSAVREKLPMTLAPSRYDGTVVELHRLLDARQELGFILLDQYGIKDLVKNKPQHVKKQTAYIPPRIWAYQVNRLHECLNEFMAHQEQVEKCFHFCIDAFAKNYGSLSALMSEKKVGSKSPFKVIVNRKLALKKGRIHHGHFDDTADKFDLSDLLSRWVGRSNSEGLTRLTSYLSLIQFAGLAYICNFSLMRIEEASSLRLGCLDWEDDEKLGRIPILIGETTKTVQDSDARWPTSPSVQVAIDAMSSVARLRMRCAEQNPVVSPTEGDKANPYLYDRSYEPWAPGHITSSYAIRKRTPYYKYVFDAFPNLFDKEKLKITQEDIKIAKLVTPTLNLDEFQVGTTWPLAWHQLRRTGAVNMFASGILSNSSMQYLMKHRNRLMPLYYGKEHTKLCLNNEARDLVLNSMYEVMGKEIQGLLSDSFVSPYGDKRKEMIVVNLVTESDAKKFSDSAKRGEISFRSMRLGGCMKRDPCPYGGYESISHCTGSDGGQPCVYALYDRDKADSNKKYLDTLEKRLLDVPIGSPLRLSLEAEKRGLEGYFDVISRS